VSSYRPFPSDNGHSGYGWPAQRPPSGNGKAQGLLDLSKGGLGIGMVATIAWGLFMAGQTWGTYQERGVSMQTQLVKLESRVSKIEEQTSDIKTIVQQIRDQPRWSMHVDKR
jgi:hypothetical protein